MILDLFACAMVSWKKERRRDVTSNNNASYISQKLDYINVTEIIKNSELIDSNIELNENGTLTFKKLVELCTDDNKKRILHKILFNVVRDNEVTLISKDNSKDNSKDDSNECSEETRPIRKTRRR